MRCRGWLVVAMTVLSLRGVAFAENTVPDVWVPGPRLVVFEEFSRAT